jgi:hypothetical protein
MTSQNMTPDQQRRAAKIRDNRSGKANTEHDVLDAELWQMIGAGWVEVTLVNGWAILTKDGEKMLAKLEKAGDGEIWVDKTMRVHVKHDRITSRASTTPIHTPCSIFCM